MVRTEKKLGKSSAEKIMKKKYMNDGCNVNIWVTNKTLLPLMAVSFYTRGKVRRWVYRLNDGRYFGFTCCGLLWNDTLCGVCIYGCMYICMNEYVW